jgi:hypothetical protein
VILEYLQEVPAKIMAFKEFLKMAIHISEALAYVHERNIVHNAIHPRYIFLLWLY